MSDQGVDWKNFRLRFCPETVRKPLETLLLIADGDKFIGEDLGYPVERNLTAHLHGKSTAAVIWEYLMTETNVTWGEFYKVVFDRRRWDILEDILDNQAMQEGIRRCYYNSEHYKSITRASQAAKQKENGPREDDDPMHGFRDDDTCVSKVTDCEDAGAECQAQPTVASPDTLPPVNGISSTGNVFIINNPGTVTFQGVPSPSPTSPNFSQASMSGGFVIPGPNSQNAEKRKMPPHERQNKKMVNRNEETMETDGPASGGLPDFSSSFGPQAVINGQLNHSQDRNISPNAEGHRCGNMNGTVQRSHSDLGSNGISYAQMQQAAPVLHSNVPPSRSQSMTEQVSGNVAQKEASAATSEEGKHKSWPSHTPPGSAAASTSSGSEPWNVKYSEFRRGRVLLLANQNTWENTLRLGKYFYNSFAVGVKFGYWNIENEMCDEVGQEIMQDITMSNWIAICLDQHYLNVIKHHENARINYTPVPKNKSFNIRYTYDTLKAEHQRLAPNGRKIILFYTPDVDLRHLPAWLMMASMQVQYKLPITKKDGQDLGWIFKQDNLLNDHLRQRNVQAKLYKRDMCS